MFFLQIFPLKVARAGQIFRSKVTAVSYLHSCVIDTNVRVTAVSLTPLCMSQRCQWYHCACAVCNRVKFPYKTVFQIIRENIWQSWLHTCVIDTVVTCTAVSLTPLWHAQRYHWHRCDMHSGIIDTAVTCTAESLTLLWYAHCTAVSLTPLCNQRCRFSPRIYSEA
jgi:hypothetical protein